MRRAVILLAHGSGAETARKEFRSLAARLNEHLTVPVRRATLREGGPDFITTVDHLVTSGVQEIILVPLFVFTGKHIQESVSSSMARVREKHPAVDFTNEGSLASSCEFRSSLLNRILTRLESGSSPGKDC